LPLCFSCVAYEIQHSLDPALLTNQNCRYFYKTHLATLYGIESISSSHSASSQLSGEFMQLHSIHTLANVALKETVPPQSRTSPHVTVKNICSIQRIQGKCKLFKILNDKKYIFNTVNIYFTVFRGKRRVAQKS